jgi:hypothetical protein
VPPEPEPHDADGPRPLKITIVTGYVPIPGHPRAEAEYERLGEQLRQIRGAPLRVFRCKLEDCWLWEHVTDRKVQHAVADNPAKNSVAYHVVQHQKTAWLLQALDTDAADVFVWIDYGISHQSGVTAAVIDEFLLRVRRSSEIVLPGGWERAEGANEVDWRFPNWRFCGCSLVVPRGLVRPFHEAVRQVTLERLSVCGQLTWEINDWAEVERRKMLPMRWYRATHNQTQFTNYTDATA